MDAPTVLIVEDDTSLANLIAHQLHRHGMTASTTDSTVDAIMRLQRMRFDAILLDVMLAGTSGLYVVEAVRDLPAYERPKVVIITGARSNLLTNLDRSLVRAVIFKPLDVTALASFVRSLVRVPATAHEET
jgi:two-component system, OmpR family, response regulator